jgi:MFS family permease
MSTFSRFRLSFLPLFRDFFPFFRDCLRLHSFPPSNLRLTLFLGLPSRSRLHIPSSRSRISSFAGGRYTRTLPLCPRHGNASPTGLSSQRMVRRSIDPPSLPPFKHLRNYRYGRSPVYFIGFALFTIFQLMSVFANNIACLLIGRFLAGASGAAFLSVAGGSVADLFAPAEVGAPMQFYTAGPFLGPVVGPIISGFVNQHLNWRWTWRILIMCVSPFPLLSFPSTDTPKIHSWAAVEFVLLLAFVPETYMPAVLKKKAQRLRKQGRTDVKAPMEVDTRSIPSVIATSCTRPFRAFLPSVHLTTNPDLDVSVPSPFPPSELLATEPMAFMLCLWTSLLLGILYMCAPCCPCFSSSFSLTLFPFFAGPSPPGESSTAATASRLRSSVLLTSLSVWALPPERSATRFGTSAFSLTWLSPFPSLRHSSLFNSVYFVAADSSLALLYRFYLQKTEELGRRPPPEEHLRKGLYGAIICPISLFWFAFTTYSAFRPSSRAAEQVELTLLFLGSVGSLDRFPYCVRFLRTGRHAQFRRRLYIPRRCLVRPAYLPVVTRSNAS